jgi:hypothetical protein
MLTAQEREAVIEAIALYLINKEARPTVTALVDDYQFGLRLPDPPVRSALQWARAIVEYCDSDAWAHVPPWLFHLLSRMQPARPDLATVLDRIRVAPPRWVGPAANDPLDAIWLGRLGMPFVNRRTLREHIRHMSLSDTGPAVLIVTGPQQSGKSYTVELLTHFARERRIAAMALPREERPAPVAVGVVTVQRQTGASVTPMSLAIQFADVMLAPGLDRPADDATPSRMNEYLSQWVLEQAAATGREWWLVLDGLNDPDLTDDCMGFVTKLAEKVAQRTYGHRVRLVLIGCPPALVAGMSADRLASEEIGQIGEVDLEPFFEHLLVGKGIAAPPPAAVKVAVLVATKDLPNNGERMKRLNEKLRTAVAEAASNG